MEEQSTMNRKKPHKPTGASAKTPASVILTRIVLVSLLVSLAFSLGALILSALNVHYKALFFREKEDYIKIALQCVLGLSVLYLPSMLKKRLGLVFTDGMQIIFVIFLYAAIILGEASNFYRTFPHWDTLLHTLSGVMLGAFGFSVIDILNKYSNGYVKLSPLFVAVFSFCFAVTLDTLWEILEFSMDFLMDLNMQQYMTRSGVILIGKDAVFDTMKDLIVDVLGALGVCVAGYFSKKRTAG
jgi:hypothetical protein